MIEPPDAATLSADIASASERLLRAMNEWTEDAIMAAFLARLPVAHIGYFHHDPLSVCVVLAGGHVWASRRWRLQPDATRSEPAG